MADREKVIKGLEIHLKPNSRCVGCPYPNNGLCGDQLYCDALSLLKAQEPVEPIEMIDDFYPIGDPLRTIGWRCGKCGGRMGGYENYCPECGRAVKWDG